VLQPVPFPAAPPSCQSLTQDTSDFSEALQHLVGRFDGFIRRTAARRGLVGAELDEVVQDLRIRVWKAAMAPGGIRVASATYIHRTAVSATLDVIRRGRTRKAQAVSLDLVAPSALTAPNDPSGSLEEADLVAVVEQALTFLQPARRAAVQRYLAGFDRFEIAAALGWSEGKARNLLYRGLDDLRRILQGRGITSAGRAENARHSLRSSARPPWSSAVTRHRPRPSGSRAAAHGGSR
jgi:RNA polymerase sigma-70 factor (ECF subfamily)